MKRVNTMQYPDPQSFRGFVLWQDANRWEKFVNSRLQPLGVNQTGMFHLIALGWLLVSQPIVTQVDVAHYTGMTPMNVSKTLKKLEKIRLISRTVGSDTRSKTLLITPEGMSILHESAGILKLAHDDFFH
jgi:DNA-binding MarR family transcriptional regulator